MLSLGHCLINWTHAIRYQLHSPSIFIIIHFAWIWIWMTLTLILLIWDCNASNDNSGQFSLEDCLHDVHDDVIKWKHFPRYSPLVRGIHRSPVNSPHRGQWRGAMMFSLIYVWTNGWVNNRAHHDVIVMGAVGGGVVMEEVLSYW